MNPQFSHIRLIASDIDGTLLQGGRTAISERLFTQVRALKEQGIRFCAASGRQHGSLRKLFRPVEKEICYICENGAVVFSPEGEVLSRTPMEREAALRLSHRILEVPQFEVLISGAETSYLIPKSPDYVGHIRYFVGNDVTLIEKPEDIEEDILKVSAYCPDGALQYQESWREEWPQFAVALGGEKWLDCGTASKRDGILGLCKALGISPEDVLAFGDNYNDIPMLQAVGMPVAMEGGPEAVKSRFARRAACPEDFMEKTLGLGAEFVRK